MVYHILSYWTDFDGWCLAHGFDPLELPSRRLFSAAWRWMTENADSEGVEKIINALDQNVQEYESELRAKAIKAAASAATEDDKPKMVPIKPFRAPPGWTPPGWSEESAYKNSVAGMKGVTQTGGGRIGGTVK